MQQRVRLEGPALHQQCDRSCLHAAEPAHDAQVPIHPATFTLNTPGQLTGPQCGAFKDVNLPVKVSKKGKKSAGVFKVTASAKAPSTKPPTDKDTYIMKCVPGCAPS